MTPISDYAELPAVNRPFITLGSGRTISKASLFIVLQAGGWTAAYAVCALAATQRYGFWPSLLDTLMWAIAGCVVTLGLHHVYRRARRLRYSYLKFAVIAMTLSVLLAPVWFFIEQITLKAILPLVLHFDALRPIFAEDAARTARQSLFFGVYPWPFYSIILFTWAALYFGVNAILDLESERANVVHALKLDPHFLFNALNGIATLVREQDSVTAAAMIDALSIFLRSTLRRLDTPELRVAEEIELIEQYLRIQRYRFGARLHAVVDVRPETLDAQIPTLILQPLVENAVRYGVLPRDAGGSLWVSVRKELEVLVVSVEDDGPGLGDGPFTAFGMGLANSSERLNALYGTAASLSIGSRADGTGCAVSVRLPFRPASTLEPCDSESESEIEALHA